KEATISLCHPERSEGSLFGERSYAPLRACPRAKRRDDKPESASFDSQNVLSETYWEQTLPCWGGLFPALQQPWPAFERNENEKGKQRWSNGQQAAPASPTTYRGWTEVEKVEEQCRSGKGQGEGKQTPTHTLVHNGP